MNFSHILSQLISMCFSWDLERQTKFKAHYKLLNFRTAVCIINFIELMKSYSYVAFLDYLVY